MINKKLIRLALLCICISAYSNLLAQQSKTGKSCQCGFGTINQGGVFVAGEMLPGGNFQSINGFRYKEWFGGVGVGVDFYRYRTIPVFIDIRRTILNKPTSPFIYADFGVNYPWMRDSDKGSYISQDFRSGYYFDFGAGYRFNLGKKHNLLFSAGYTEKRTREDRGELDYASSTFPFPTKIDTYKYTMKRVILRVGWALW